IYFKKIAFGLFLCFLVACQSDSSSSANKNTIIGTPAFSFETTIDSTEMPNTSIFLTFDDNKIKVAQTHSCLKITPAEYERHDIPADAIDACGGWWAGAGDYFYLTLQDEHYQIYQGSVDEMQEAPGYNYQPIGKLSKTGDYQVLQ
ncbi:MAG: hypothetical protein AAFO94_14945, partial [Bacteroidota bacterium]